MSQFANLSMSASRISEIFQVSQENTNNPIYYYGRTDTRTFK